MLAEQISPEFIASQRPWLEREEGNAHIASYIPKVLKLDKARGVYEVVDHVDKAIPAVLLKEHWDKIDSAVLKQFKTHAPVYCWLADNGCRYCEFQGRPVPIMLEEKVAEGAMFKLEATPLPITHSDWRTPRSRLNAQRVFDPVLAEASARRVGEKVEETLFNGLLTCPGRLETTLANDWPGDTPGQTPDEIGMTRDIHNSLTHLKQSKFYGPYLIVWNSKHLCVILKQDAKDNKRTVMDWVRDELTRLMHKVTFIESHTLPDEVNMLIVQRTPDVVRCIDALPIITIQWPVPAALPNQVGFKCLAIQVPQVRTDFNGNGGIAVIRSNYPKTPYNPTSLEQVLRGSR